LRDGVTFHDGEPFNSEAVKYMMDSVHDPAAPTVITPGAYGFYESTEAPDDLTVVINLSAAWAPLIDAFSFSYRPVSPAAGEQFGEDLGQNPVGTGPFKFQEWVPNSHVTIVNNPDYNWPAPGFQHEGPAYLEEVTFRLIPESAPRVAALENDEAQVIEVLPQQDAERIKNDSDFEVIVGITPGIPYGYGINVRKPPTDELAVRQAMNWAIDQDSVARTVFGPLQSLGAFQPAYSVLVPQTFGYEPAADEVYDYDPEMAMQVLEEAGWTVGDDGIREKNGQKLEVLMATWETLGVEEVIQAQFREVGIDWQIRVNPVVATNEAARREEVHSSPLPAARSDPNVLAFFHSRNQGTGFNFIFHSNARLDELLDAGASEPDEDARVEIYSEIQMIIMEEAMWLSVHQRDNVSAKSVDVKGDIVWDRGLFPYLYDLHLTES
jgi:peptide/nickel transport system substrate-binding protein